MVTTDPNYQTWDWDYKSLSLKEPIEKQIKFFIKAGILAPSTHNTQPWKFLIKENKLTIFPDNDRRLPIIDPQNQALYISLGACVENIMIAAKYYGYEPTAGLKFRQNNHLVIEMMFKTRKRRKTESNLAPFISQRFSNKLEYSDREIKPDLLEQLEEIREGSVRVKITSGKTQLKMAAQLLETATAELTGQPFFTQELANWMRTNNTKLEDGMPGFVVGFSQKQSELVKIILPKLPIASKIIAKKDRGLLLSSSGFGVIYTNKLTPQFWLDAGRVYERFVLSALVYNIHCTPMHSIVENKKTNSKLGQILNLAKTINLMFFFRYGYSKTKPYHTPRRSVIDVMIPEETERRLAQVTGTIVNFNVVPLGKYLINYVSAGQGQPLLLIHGGNIGWGQWYPNIKSLAKNFKVYALDLPGAGRSSRVDFGNIDLERDMVDTTEAFIKYINVKKIHLVGSSNGGWVTLKLAQRKLSMIDKLVLVDSLGFTEFMGVPDRILGIYPLAKFLSQTALKPVRTNKNIEKFLRNVFYNQNLDLAPQFIDYFYKTMETAHNLLFISRLSSFFGVRPEFIMKHQLPKIKNHSLIIWGEYDKLMPVKYNQPQWRLLPNSRFEVIKNAGHIPSIEKSGEFNKLLVKFLSN